MEHKANIKKSCFFYGKLFISSYLVETYEKGFEKEFKTLENIELLTPQVFSEVKGIDKTMCANVDLYSGLVYKVLGIPEDLYTPIFAVARTAGWCAHRLEELTSGGKIIRPAYKSVSKPRTFKPIIER